MRTLPADAICDILIAGHLYRCGGAHAERTCGHGASHRTTLYLVELKLNQSAEAAMKQIDLQQYSDRFALCGLPVVKVAINFSAETGRLQIGRFQLNNDVTNAFLY